MRNFNEMPKSLINRIRNEENINGNIAKCAEMILEAFDIDAYNQYVPIVKILKSLGIKIYKQEMTLKKLSAYISVNPEYYDQYGTTKIACVNEEDKAGHMRFALAHELAHYIFDYDESHDTVYYNTYMKDSSDKDENEKRANEFAANLLMPKTEFCKKVEDYKKLTGNSKPDIIVNLADHFGVLTSSIMKRFDELQIKMD